MKNSISTACVNTAKKVQNVSDRAIYALAGSLAAMNVLPASAVRAIEIESVTIQDGAAEDPDKLIGSALGLVMMFAQWIGGFLIVYGAFMLFLAMKNEEPESKSKAIMTMGCGIGLFCLKPILVGAGIIGG